MSCTHNYSVCRLPQVFIKLEFTEYTVRENIGSENFALKVCAVAADVAFPVQVSFNASSRTARGMKYLLYIPTLTQETGPLPSCIGKWR